MAKPPPLAERLLRAIRFLIRTLNSDGGVPAIGPDDPSGCWTTAETLEAIVRSPWFENDFIGPVRKMAQFLITAQSQTKGKAGGWPLVADGKHPSTMATAHAIIGLTLARPFLEPPIATTFEAVVRAGVDWLKKRQGSSGGWGVEPSAGPSGQEARVVATFLALRALAQVGETVHCSQCVRNGVDFLWSLYDGNGFSPALGRKPDACTTARAFLAIRDAAAVAERDGFENRALRFVMDCRPTNARLWDLDTEVYVPDGASGQIVFNYNTTAELLEFLVHFDNTEDQQLFLVEWFQRNQRDDGSWCLGANDRLQPDIITWPTNEAVIALSEFFRGYAVTRPAGVSSSTLAHSQPVPPQKTRSLLLGLVSTVAAVEGIVLLALLLGAPSCLEKSWSALPNDFRSTVLWGSVVGVAVGIAANLLTQSVFWLVRRLRVKRDQAG